MIYLHDDGKQYRLRRGRFTAPIADLSASYQARRVAKKL
jgi:hypothetical protein